MNKFLFSLLVTGSMMMQASQSNRFTTPPRATAPERIEQTQKQRTADWKAATRLVVNPAAMGPGVELFPRLGKRA